MRHVPFSRSAASPAAGRLVTAISARSLLRAQAEDATEPAGGRSRAIQTARAYKSCTSGRESAGSAGFRFGISEQSELQGIDALQGPSLTLRVHPQSWLVTPSSALYKEALPSILQGNALEQTNELPPDAVAAPGPFFQAPRGARGRSGFDGPRCRNADSDDGGNAPSWTGQLRTLMAWQLSDAGGLRQALRRCRGRGAV